MSSMLPRRRRARDQLLVLLALGVLLFPFDARTEELGTDAASEAIALEAARIVEEHCAEVAGGTATAAAVSVTTVSEVWRRVSEELEQSRKVYLLYWRGVLGQCLDQEERALTDLTEFVEARRGSDLWSSLVADARRRVTYLQRKLGRRRGLSPAQRRAAAGVGVGFAVGSAALAGSGGAEWEAARSVAGQIYAEPHDSDDLAALISEGDAHATASRVTTGLSIGLGAAAVGSLVLAATRQGGATWTSVVLPVPLEGGGMLVWGQRW